MRPGSNLANVLPGLATALGLLACYGTTLVVALLSILGLSIAVNESAWAGAISIFAVLAVIAVAASALRHRRALPVVLAIPGAALVLWAMYGSYDRLIELAGFALLVAASVLDWRMRRTRDAATDISWIEPRDLDDRLARGPAPLIVDVRGPDEFDGPLSRIPQARNLPVSDLPARLGEIAAAKNDPVILVCKTDRRSSAAAMLLQGSGFRQVRVLRGGMERWNAEGRATARQPMPSSPT